MADISEEKKNILIKIIDVYTPFLKKLLAHLNRKEKPLVKDKYEKLEYVLKVFREGDSKEKLIVYEACKDMLDKWYQRYKDIQKKQDKEESNEKAVFTLDGPDLSDDDLDISSASRNNGKSESASNSSDKSLVVNVKKEKVDSAAASEKTQASTPVPKPVQVVTAMPVTTILDEPPAAEEEASKEITFVCASCQFRTTDEVDFMKHARTDHRTDLSLWCKSCGKCFSNAGVLVSHIKEANCVKEEMIYRCGVKDCTFETPSGQTFVHHLRHCHKGSPFIFCVHCQKIFTLPHCLILHMQNDCPFKDKNRKNPGEVTAAEKSTPAAPVTTPAAKVITSAPAKTVKQEPGVTNSTPKPPAVATPVTPTTVMSSQRGAPASRGRGRISTRSRYARSSRHFSDSSDSDDPDDPSWRPEETSHAQPLRRSARWASRVSDARNPDLEDEVSASKKSKNFIEQPVSKIVHCPCCDFSAVFESLLREHYVASHKHDKKNACSVCNVKFESVDLFIDHFSQHEQNKTSAEKKDVSESSNDSSRTENVVEEAKKKESSTSEYLKDIPLECVPGKFSSAQGQNAVQIPYQTAIHEKLAKDSRIKSFEDLKSNADVAKMRSEPKLKHFFKCTVYNCTFTTDDDEFYVGHLKERHKDKKVYCTYCFQEYSEVQPLVEHMFKEHSKRCYQCSACFYRAFSKPHIQIHIRNAHKAEKASVYSCSLHLRPNYVFPEEDGSTMVTTYPYVCAVGDCKYQTFDPKEFTKHTDLNHRAVSQLYCHYCKGDFISLKRLLSHYHLHGINNFQCNYCVHGSETKEEILLHLCNNHADKAFKVYVRNSQESDVGAKPFDGMGKPFDGVVKTSTVPVSKVLPKPADPPQAGPSPPSLPSFQRSQMAYPEEVLCLDKDFFCRIVSCEEECKNFDMYLNHMKDEHCALNVLCPYCSAVCLNSTAFENHMKCHGPNLYACPVDECQWHSSLKLEVEEHVKYIHKLQSTAKVIRENLDSALNPIKIESRAFPTSKTKVQFYICPFCYYENTDFKTMKNHIYAEFIYRRFQCNLCKEKMCSRRGTKSHFSASHMHHNVKCEVHSNAEIEFLTKTFLTHDIQRQFVEYLETNDTGNGDVLCLFADYKCEECNSVFKDIADWHYHWVNCVSKVNQPYTCNHCTVRFGSMAQLKYHTNKSHIGSTVSYILTENVFLKQTAIRKLQLGKMQFFKTFLNPYLKSKNLYGDKLKSFQFDSKYYKCGHCNFNDTFRCNILKHISGCHKEKSTVVEKIRNSVDVPHNFNNQKKTKAGDSSATKSQPEKEPEKEPENRPYVCSFCSKKVEKLEELEKHVTSTHAAAASDSYPFYYFPESNWEYSEKDTELYECAYCSVSQENLFHLKRHCDNLHSGVAFKVRGKRSKTSPTIQCNQCDLKVMSQELLEKHCLFHHPKITLKSPKKEEKQIKRKSSDIKLDEPPAKALKENSEKYECGYCEHSCVFYIQMIVHHEAEHLGKPFNFGKGSDFKDSEDAQLFECDFCSYLAEQQVMLNHLIHKHKHCFVCAYCGKAYDVPSKIAEHAQISHKGLPVKLVKVDDFATLINRPAGAASNSRQYEGEGFSYYGNKPDDIDLHNITVHLPTSSNTQLPVVYLSQLFPLFPSVYVEDFAKSLMKK